MCGPWQCHQTVELPDSVHVVVTGQGSGAAAVAAVATTVYSTHSPSNSFLKDEDIDAFSEENNVPSCYGYPRTLGAPKIDSIDPAA